MGVWYRKRTKEDKMTNNELIKKEFDELEGFIKKAKKDKGLSPAGRKHRDEANIKNSYQRIVEEGIKPLSLPVIHHNTERTIIVSPDGRSILARINRKSFLFSKCEDSWSFYRSPKITKRRISEALKEYSEVIEELTRRQAQLINVLGT